MIKKEKNNIKLIFYLWNLEKYDNDVIMKKMGKFYNNIKTVPFILFVLDTIKSNQSDNLLIQLLQRDTTDNFSLFILLFNYENFQLFHNCLKEWKLYATPTEESFDKLIQNLKIINNIYNIMSKSIRYKNTQSHHDIRNCQYNRIFDNTIDLHTSVQKDNCFPDLGIISGNMSSGYNHNVLSNNTADIESKLFGIGSTNLVKTSKNYHSSN